MMYLRTNTDWSLTARIRAFFCVLALTALPALLAVPAAAQSVSYNWHNVQIGGGGYVPAVIFNGTQPGLMYVRTDIGGAYRWNATTRAWLPLLDGIGWNDWDLTGVDSLATDPVNPNRLYLLAGSYTNSFDPHNGAVLISTDQGTTWTRSPLPFKVGGNMPGRNLGERLAIDPNDDPILFLGARSGNGLWKSTNFGATWSRVTSFPATGSYVPDPTDSTGYNSDPIGVTWVVFDKRTGQPGQPTKTIYVGVASLGTSVYRSQDGGTTWTALPGQPTSPAFMPHHAVLASTGMLYLTYNNNAGPYDGTLGTVWKYDTAAGTWTNISPDPTSATNSYFGYGGLTVDAQHPNTVMVSALNAWWPDTIIWRSTDGGATWKAIWQWASYPNRTLQYTQNISVAPWLTFNAFSNPPVLSPQLGWMVGDLKIDPFNSDHLLYGTGATLYGTNNLTAWDSGGQIAISVMTQGIEETSVQDLISPPSGAPLLSALSDIGGFRHNDVTVVPTQMYNTPVFTTTSSLDFAELSPLLMVRVGSGASNSNGSNNTNIGFSWDGGADWVAQTSAGGNAASGVVALSADGSSIVWSPSNTSVYYSLNNGQSWTASTGLNAGAQVASDRTMAGKFYGFSNGGFYVSVNQGATFASTGATGLPASVSKIKAVAGHPGEIWLAAGAGGLWHSTNAGRTFAQVTGVQQAFTIGFGKAQVINGYPALYSSAEVGGVFGIFRSTTTGQTWTRINDDSHQYASTGAAITGDPRIFGRVYVSTNGRGIIYGDSVNGN